MRADLGVGPLQTQGHELRGRVLPQAVELRLLPAELDQQKSQLLGLRPAPHGREEDMTAFKLTRYRHGLRHRFCPATPSQGPAAAGAAPRLTLTAACGTGTLTVLPCRDCGVTMERRSGG